MLNLWEKWTLEQLTGSKETADHIRFLLGICQCGRQLSAVDVEITNHPNVDGWGEESGEIDVVCSDCGRGIAHRTAFATVEDSEGLLGMLLHGSDGW